VACRSREALARSYPHCRTWIRVGCRFLDVTQRAAGVERGGDQGVPQGVRADRFGDAGSSGDTPHDPAGAVAIEALSVGSAEDRSVETFADRQVEATGGARRERDGNDLPQDVS
jgi:hypothetical protein